MTINWKKILAVVGGLVILMVLAYLVLWLKPESSGVELGDQNETSTVASDISGWKTYRNTDFEFRYPPDWSADNSIGDRIFLSSPEKKFLDSDESPVDISFGIYEKGPVSIAEFIQSYSEGWYSFYTNRQSINVGGMDALKFNDKEKAPQEAVFVNLGSRVLLVNLSDYYSGVSDYKPGVFNKILSTFKFIAPEVRDVSGWKTYRNEKYGFELKYPEEYTLTQTKIGDCFYTTLNGDGPYFCVKNHTNIERLSLLMWWEKQADSRYLIRGSDVKISGKTALAFYSGPDDFPSTSIIIDNIDNIVEISGSGIPNEAFSTFKFIDQK